MLDIKPKVIVFDDEGVLLDWKGGLRSTATLLNTTPEKVHATLQLYLPDLELGKLEVDGFWRHAAAKYGYVGDPHNLAKAWVEGQPMIKASWELAKSLKTSYRVIVCTNNWLGVLENQVKAIHDFSLFEMIIDSSQEKVRKPDIAMFNLVEARAGESGKRVFLIDDSISNCEGALRFGWQVYNFNAYVDGGKASSDAIRALLV